MLIENKVDTGVELNSRSVVEVMLCTASEIMKVRYQDTFKSSMSKGLAGAYHNNVTTATTPNGAVGFVLFDVRLEHRPVHGMCVVGKLKFAGAGWRDVKSKLRIGSTFAPRIIGKDLITFDMIGNKV